MVATSKEFAGSSHLFGKGCIKCGNISSGKKLRYTNEEFIKLSKIKHGDKYSYKKTKYIRGTDKVTIICNIHGEFQQRANGHLNGSGCDDCGEDYKSNKSRLKISVIDQRIEKIWGKNVPETASLLGCPFWFVLGCIWNRRPLKTITFIK